jgi:hypothetical protein
VAISELRYRDVASVSEQLPTYSGEAGSIAILDHTHLTLPEKVSLRRVAILAGWARTTQSQAIEQIDCCIGGRALVSVLTCPGPSESFLIEDGEAIFLPSRSTHIIERIGEDAAYSIKGIGALLLELINFRR